MTSNAWNSYFMRFLFCGVGKSSYLCSRVLNRRERRGGETIPNGQIAHCAEANRDGKRPKWVNTTPCCQGNGQNESLQGRAIMEKSLQRQSILEMAKIGIASPKQFLKRPK